MPDKRATREQVEARVAEVVTVLLDGAQAAWDIVPFVRQREGEAGSPWHVGEGDSPLSASQIFRYVNKAQSLIALSVKGDRDRHVGRHIAQRRHLFAKAVQQGDVRAALAILDSEAKLCGLFPDHGSTANGRNGAIPNGNGITINLFERVNILAQQLREQLALDPGVPAGALSGIGGPQSLDQAPADAEAGRVLATG
jgi:hypothetical protein